MSLGTSLQGASKFSQLQSSSLGLWKAIHSARCAPASYHSTTGSLLCVLDGRATWQPLQMSTLWPWYLWPLAIRITRGQAVKVGFRSTLNFFDAKNSSNDATKCCVEQVSAKLWSLAELACSDTLSCECRTFCSSLLGIVLSTERAKVSYCDKGFCTTRMHGVLPKCPLPITIGANRLISWNSGSSNSSAAETLKRRPQRITATRLIFMSKHLSKLLETWDATDWKDFREGCWHACLIVRGIMFQSSRQNRMHNKHSLNLWAQKIVQSWFVKTLLALDFASRITPPLLWCGSGSNNWPHTLGPKVTMGRVNLAKRAEICGPVFPQLQGIHTWILSKSMFPLGTNLGPNWIICLGRCHGGVSPRCRIEMHRFMHFGSWTWTGDSGDSGDSGGTPQPEPSVLSKFHRPTETAVAAVAAMAAVALNHGFFGVTTCWCGGQCHGLMFIGEGRMSQRVPHWPPQATNIRWTFSSNGFLVVKSWHFQVCRFFPLDLLCATVCGAKALPCSNIYVQSSLILQAANTPKALQSILSHWNGNIRTGFLKRSVLLARKDLAPYWTVSQGWAKRELHFFGLVGTQNVWLILCLSICNQYIPIPLVLPGLTNVSEQAWERRWQVSQEPNSRASSSRAESFRIKWTLPWRLMKNGSRVTRLE